MKYEYRHTSPECLRTITGLRHGELFIIDDVPYLKVSMTKEDKDILPSNHEMAVNISTGEFMFIPNTFRAQAARIVGNGPIIRLCVAGEDQN